MSMKFEAAVATKKRTGEEFNTDSVNINGKVPPREVILDGYKGAGIIDAKAYFALNSSFVEGYSDASVASFEDFASHFCDKGNNPITVINEYFRNTVSALNSLNHLSKEISSGVAYCGNRNVILARSGDTSLFSYSNGVLKKINPENSMHDDAKSNYGCYTIRDVSVDDIFILLSPGVAGSLSDKDITDICRVSDGSVKKIVNIVSRVAEAKPSSGGIGVIAIKILLNDFVADEEPEETVAEEISAEETVVSETAEETETAPELPREHEEIVGGFVTAFDFENGETITGNSEISVETTSEEATDENIDTEETILEEPKKKSKKGLFVLVIIAGILIAGVLFGVAKFTDFFSSPVETTTVIETTTEPESTTEEETTEEETTEEETTEEETTEEETTTAQSYTYYYRTTTQPATSAPTTTERATTERATTERATTERTTTEHTTKKEVVSTTKKAETTSKKKDSETTTKKVAATTTTEKVQTTEPSTSNTTVVTEATESSVETEADVENASTSEEEATNESVSEEN